MTPEIKALIEAEAVKRFSPKTGMADEFALHLAKDCFIAGAEAHARLSGWQPIATFKPSDDPHEKYIIGWIDGCWFACRYDKSRGVFNGNGADYHPSFHFPIPQLTKEGV